MPAKKSTGTAEQSLQTGGDRLGFSIYGNKQKALSIEVDGGSSDETPRIAKDLTENIYIIILTKSSGSPIQFLYPAESVQKVYVEGITSIAEV